MPAYYAKDSSVQAQQLKVEELTLFANNPLLTVLSSDLNLQINEPVDQVFMILKQVVGGTVTGIHGTVGADGTSITITGESAAISTTSYIVKYSCKQS